MKPIPPLTAVLLFSLASFASATAKPERENELQLPALTVEGKRETPSEFGVTVAAEHLPPVTAQSVSDFDGLPPLVAVGSVEDGDDAGKPMPKILVTGSRLRRE